VGRVTAWGGLTRRAHLGYAMCDLAVLEGGESASVKAEGGTHR
jgi:hypothetical protein